MTAQPPAPDKWITFLLDIYINGQPPILGTVNIKEIEEKAREVMKNHLRAFHSTLLTPVPMADQNHCLPCLDSGIHVHLWKCRNVLDGRGK
jgi:hypothetical protein